MDGFGVNKFYLDHDLTCISNVLRPFVSDVLDVLGILQSFADRAFNMWSFTLGLSQTAYIHIPDCSLKLTLKKKTFIAFSKGKILSSFALTF